MRRIFQSALTWCLRFLAFAVVLAALRYFLFPPRLLLRGQMLAYSRHPAAILLHISGGIVAMTVGLFQFVERLRDSRPTLHRTTGYVYLTAVLVAGCTGLLLSPDTPLFAADGLGDLTRFDFSVLGLSPSFLGYSASSRFSPSQFLLVEVGFAALAVMWLLTSALALACARQKRFGDHRAWMIRSYSLTFAAATVRLAGLPFLILTRNPVAAITCTFWSWVLNLMAAEWIIRSSPESAVARRLPQRA